MTTGISLVRENAESMEPPRMLWVTFPLGHPLGKAGDAEFQHGVIRHALDLLGRPEGPVLEDFPLDVPPVEVEQARACPVSFARSSDGESWQSRLANELGLLKPWYELSRRRRRTTVGISKSGIDEILQRLALWLDDESQPLPDAKWFKYAIEDAKAYYSESLTAQPGSYPQGAIPEQLWEETVLGEGLKRYYEYFSERPDMVLFARLIATRESIGGSTGGEAELQNAIKQQTGEEQSDD